MCDQAAVMQHGEILEVLSIDAMRAGQTAHPYTRTLLDASANRVA
jgi:peptide/nickel transport system ATP-binding protein